MKNERLLVDLSDEQCEKVVGGVGAGEVIAGAGTQGWFGRGSSPGDPNNTGLIGSGQFIGPASLSTGASGITVWSPNKG